jgi:hypothetical protein
MSLSVSPASPATAPLPGPPPKSWVVRNVVTLVVVGVLVSAWLIRFTDWFETAAGLLALGGVLSWLAFVSRAIPEDRLKHLQEQLAAPVLESARTWKVCLGVLGTLLVVSLFVGSLQVEGGKSGFDARVQVYRPGADRQAVDSDYLPANGRVRSLWWVWPWSSRDLSVKATDLPEGTVRVRPTCWPWWGPTMCVAPNDLYRPVVLLAAHPSLVNEADKSKDAFRLFVTVGDQQYETSFDGHSLWIGCRSGDFEVPAEVRLRPEWKKGQDDPTAGALILSPQDRKPPDLPDTVASPDTVQARLQRSEGGRVTFVTKTYQLRLRQPAAVADIVQLLWVGNEEAN